MLVVLVLVLVLMARWTKRPSGRPCKSRMCFLLCRCCYCNCGVDVGGVGVGISPNGTLDKETFKKTLQVNKVLPVMSLLLLLLL